MWGKLPPVSPFIYVPVRNIDTVEERRNFGILKVAIIQENEAPLSAKTRRRWRGILEGVSLPHPTKGLGEHHEENGFRIS